MKLNRRKQQKRNLFPKVLIVSEGYTERNYFQFMKEDDDYKPKLSAVNPVLIKAKYSSPIHIVEEALRLKKEALKANDSFQSVWVAFDHENKNDRRKAYDLAQKNDIKVLFSAICFETWYLLHYSKSFKAFLSQGELINELKKVFPNYKKVNQNHFEIFKENLKYGMENAQKLRALNSFTEEHITNLNPWTNVDELIEYLINIPG